MQDIMFATFLYAAIICFVCCLRYQPSSAATIPTDTRHLPASEPQPASLNQVSTTEPEQNLEPTNALIETEASLQLPVTPYIKDVSEAKDSQPTSLSTDHSGLDFGVTLRQAQGADAATGRSTERSRRSLVEVQSNAELTVEASGNIVLDPSKLTLRQCRAVIREINKSLPKQDRIRQKINGKDAPADWLRSQIVRHLETHPANAITLEAVS